MTEVQNNKNIKLNNNSNASSVSNNVTSGSSGGSIASVAGIASIAGATSGALIAWSFHKEKFMINFNNCFDLILLGNLSDFKQKYGEYSSDTFNRITGLITKNRNKNDNSTDNNSSDAKLTKIINDESNTTKKSIILTNINKICTNIQDLYSLIDNFLRTKETEVQQEITNALVNKYSKQITDTQLVALINNNFTPSKDNFKNLSKVNEFLITEFESKTKNLKNVNARIDNSKKNDFISYAANFLNIDIFKNDINTLIKKSFPKEINSTFKSEFSDIFNLFESYFVNNLKLKLKSFDNSYNNLEEKKFEKVLTDLETLIMKLKTNFQNQLTALQTNDSFTLLRQLNNHLTNQQYKLEDLGNNETRKQIVKLLLEKLFKGAEATSINYDYTSETMSVIDFLKFCFYCINHINLNSFF
jgi:hypothetical protein